MTVWNQRSTAAALPTKTLQVFLHTRPRTSITSTTFAKRIASLPSPTSFTTPHILVKVLYISIDPAMRVWLHPSRSYDTPIAEGDTMRAMGIGRVIYPAGRFKAGDLVTGMFGWCQYTFVNPKVVTKAHLPSGMKPSAMLGVLGITGMTAYFGLLDVGKVKRGDVVVVSTAAGATGSVVAQIAKNVYGCQVIGIAGGALKCRYLRETLGIDAVDYKDEEPIDKALKRVLGGRKLDVYFDNVGGETLEAALKCLNHGARVVICGAISGYNSEKIIPGPYNYVNLISCKARMEGFLLMDYKKRFIEAQAKLSRWVSEGAITHEEDEVVGLENAPEALMRLFRGANIGKVVVKVAETQDKWSMHAKM